MGYLFKDNHGDVPAAYSSTSNRIADYTYDAWGNIQNQGTQSWEADNTLRPHGQYYDTEIGMTYLMARYYDSSIRRFITEDPIKDGLNWYAYAGNNPVMFVDPSEYITEEEQQMYENGEMSPGAYSYLMKLTYNYYLADTDEDRRYFSELAEQFRATNYTSTPFSNWNFIISNMASKSSSGTVSKWEHYYRNNLNIEFSYDELMKLNERLPENMKWTDDVAADFHQNHTVNGQDNIKYVSADGHFEIVYNANGEIQNQYNDTDDMGTYNYCSPESDPIGHVTYDIVPYMAHGNVPDTQRRTP